MTSFKDSQEAAFRRIVRAAIKVGPFTKSERDVTLAFMNHWFVHRNGVKGIVHPGRKKLAQKAGVTPRTVTNVLAFLRRAGVLEAKAHLKGLHGDATEYAVDIDALYALSRMSKDTLISIGWKIVHTPGVEKISTRNSNIIPFPSQKVGNRSKGVA